MVNNVWVLGIIGWRSDFSDTYTWKGASLVALGIFTPSIVAIIVGFQGVREHLSTAAMVGCLSMVAMKILQLQRNESRLPVIPCLLLADRCLGDAPNRRAVDAILCLQSDQLTLRSP